MASPATYNMVVPQATTYNFAFTIKEDSTPWNLTNYTATMTVRPFAGSTTVTLLATTQNIGKGSLSIKEIIHGYRTEKDFNKALNDSGNCSLDVNCPIGNEIDPIKDEMKRSVAMMISGGSGFCTGALINNTANNGTPYFLTANHCYSDPSTWAFRFNWISTNTVCAQNTNSVSNTDFNSISGATLRARRANSDFCLVEINSPIPSSWNCVWAGWDRTTNVASTIFGIHHPSGDIMKTCKDGSPVLTNYATENVSSAIVTGKQIGRAHV